jgi:hypothetical protein
MGIYCDYEKFGSIDGVDMSHRDDDIKQLKACLAEVERDDDRRLNFGDAAEKFDVDAFESMLDGLETHRWEELTEKQRAWVHGVHERLFDEPQYESAWSAGKVAEGKMLKTPIPAVLQKPLPKKPPKRA